MAGHPTWLNGSAWIKILIHDLSVVSIIAAVALCGGLLVNSFRDDRLPLIYLSKAERFQGAVAKFGGTATIGFDAGALRRGSRLSSRVATVRYLDLPQLREIVDGKTKVILVDARPEVFHRDGTHISEPGES